MAFKVACTRALAGVQEEGKRRLSPGDTCEVTVTRHITVMIGRQQDGMKLFLNLSRSLTKQSFFKIQTKTSFRNFGTHAWVACSAAKVGDGLPLNEGSASTAVRLYFEPKFGNISDAPPATLQRRVW